MSSSSYPPSPKGQSNLESFLHGVTPVVPSTLLPMKLQQAVDNQGKVEYFLLGNLWQIYEEWSAYGVGIPLILSGGETVVQYYTPHLSAIQLYTNSDNSTEGRGIASNQSIAHDSLGPVMEWDPLPHLCLQYDETISPYWRAPFADKISELAECLPELYSLKSTELSPRSWMSVSWIPIYHIPSKGKVEDLSTHFLTFHTLSSHSQGKLPVQLPSGHLQFSDTQGSNDIMSVVGKNIPSPNNLVQAKFKYKSHRSISLPPFGLSTLKMKGQFWTNRSSGDYEKLTNLRSAAESWLKQLGVNNHDFDYYNLKCGGK